jgi:hypothetical protein
MLPKLENEISRNTDFKISCKTALFYDLLSEKLFSKMLLFFAPV